MPLPPPIRAALEEEAVVPQDVLLVRQGGREHLLWHPQGQEWPGVAGWTWADGARPEILAQLGPGRGALLEID